MTLRLTITGLAGVVAAAAAITFGAGTGCGPASPGGTAGAGQRAATKPGAHPRERLIADARQLADILERTHPDPYINGGGRIAFHRRLHRVLNAIPDEGLTTDEFYRLLRPFVAGVGDAHTALMNAYDVDERRPGGLPLRLRVVEEFLVVAGVPDPSLASLLGEKLVSVEGVPVAELVERQRRLRGIDNQYHGLQVLAEESLWFQPHMQDLVPEWRDTGRVRVELEGRDGTRAQLDLQQPAGEEADFIAPPSKVTLPVPDESGFLYAFLQAPSSRNDIAYLRFAHMVGYRETRERRVPNRRGLANTPSATDTFRSLVTEMKARRTDTLVVDVRGNHGGDSLIVDILIYFLYGKDSLREEYERRTGETGVFRYSRLYFQDRQAQSFDTINADRVVPLVEGDYEFGASFVDGEPIARRTGPPRTPSALRALMESPTFGPEFASGSSGGAYLPEHVIVLCDAGTISAGFSAVVGLQGRGATTVGTPSAQAPNAFGATTGWQLDHTGIRGQVPVIAATHFPFDPSKAHVLPVDYPLTYEGLASYGFDPHAEYLYALTLR